VAGRLPGRQPAAGRICSTRWASASAFTTFRGAMDGLIGYLGMNTWRLRPGQSLGRGAEQGLTQHLGRRPKVPGRCSHALNLGGMATLCIRTGTTERSRSNGTQDRKRHTPRPKGSLENVRTIAIPLGMGYDIQTGREIADELSNPGGYSSVVER
jgi:hypothetical protein